MDRYDALNTWLEYNPPIGRNVDEYFAEYVKWTCDNHHKVVDREGFIKCVERLGE